MAAPDTRIPIATVAVEMLSIFLAIGLGFAVTEWREARRDAARAADALASIRQELAANQQQIAEATPYFWQMARTLGEQIEAEGDAVVGERPVPGWRGLSPPQLRRASYTAASSTGALDHLPFETADRIALSYEAIESLSRAIEFAMSTAIAGGLGHHSAWLRLFGLLGEISTSAEETIAATLSSLES